MTEALRETGERNDASTANQTGIRRLAIFKGSRTFVPDDSQPDYFRRAMPVERPTSTSASAIPAFKPNS